MKIIINVKFGSDFQRETWANMFVILLRTLQVDFNNKHKKNFMKIKYEDKKVAKY